MNVDMKFCEYSNIEKHNKQNRTIKPNIVTRTKTQPYNQNSDRYTSQPAISNSSIDHSEFRFEL